mmetsp:Transcript_39453/g.106484  ORF Transcript_39453/g.106484 Transcript_39453/m.106484 type:complete len:239 (+) Transcript_39453:805-1521(+)
MKAAPMRWNVFTHEFHNPCLLLRAGYVATYAIRLVCMVICLELGTHWSPCFALGASGAFVSTGPFEIGLLAYLTLNLMWFKFTIIWRFARLWALLDGVEVQENMVRGMNNNYSLVGFWKGWHRSFNRWLVRYIYVPLGGTSYRSLNVWVVFGFVAVWHDVEPKLLAWGGMNALFMSVEAAIVPWAARTQTPLVRMLREGPFWRHACAASGTSYILVLMVVNLTGYGVGIEVGVGFILR